MRLKLASYPGLALLAAVVTSLVAWRMPPDEPPLRVGMSVDEVGREMEDKDPFRIFTTLMFDREDECNYMQEFIQGPNIFGNRRRVTVRFDDSSRVIDWQTEPLPRTRPPWLDRTLRWAGW